MRFHVLAFMFCAGCIVVLPSTDDDEIGDAFETDATETETHGEDPCEPEKCEWADPCADIECGAIYHDTQIVFGWSQPGSDCTSGCHSGPAPSAGLSLAVDDDPWCALINQPSSVQGMAWVSPGAPESSYLWHKLAGTHDCPSIGGSGSGMPPLPNSCPLIERDAALFGVITEWICCGAPKSPEDPNGANCA